MAGDCERFSAFEVAGEVFTELPNADLFSLHIAYPPLSTPEWLERGVEGETFFAPSGFNLKPRLARFSERSSPVQALEPGEVPVGGDPFATRFDRQGCQPGILHQIPGGAGGPAEIAEDLPMALSCFHHLTMRLAE